LPSLVWIPEDAPVDSFPPAAQALEQPNGLLCAGGDLSAPRLLQAYRQGIFPWYGEDEPLLWWSPNPRTLISTESFHLSRSMQRFLKQHPYTLSIDRDFHAVIDACAAPRASSPETWITEEMREAYSALHYHGYAHSLEVWENEELVGGIYGVNVGAAFCGESMFSRRSNTSKLALWTLLQQLQRWQFSLFDCQLWNDHLASLGAFEVSREDYLNQLKTAQQIQPSANWQLDTDLVHNQNHVQRT
jgi:leucyl/phenylalanyl-tRNA--protein transferase